MEQMKTALGLLQFQTDYRQTAAERAADHRFLFVDLALVISSRDVPRAVWRAAPPRGEQFLSGIWYADENHPQVEQWRH